MMLRALALALLAAISAAPAWAQERVTVTILQFADIADVEPRASSGDLPRIASVIVREKAARANVIVAHGGNALSPSFIAALDQGAHMTRMLNQMLIDVMVANIHEFDFGPDVAARRIGELSFPVLGANVMDGPRRAAGLADGVVLAAGGFRIGFVGGVRADAGTVSSPGRFRFSPLAPALRAAASAMRDQGADIVVALCAGLAAECEAALAEPGIDIVLGSAGPGPADAHTDGRRVLLRSGAEGNIMLALDLELVRTPRDIGVEFGSGADPLRAAIDAVPRRSADVVTWTAVTRQIDSRGVEPDQMIEIVAQIELDTASLSFNETIATLGGAFSSRAETMRRQEGSLADLVADALLERAGADAALINAGMIRGNRDYEAGTPILMRTMVEELPFADDLVVVTMTGAALRAALEHGFALLPAPAARFPQVAGMTVRFDPSRPAGQRVRAVEIGGRPLDPRRRYRVATNSFIARGGDGYAMIAAAPRVALAGDPPVIRDVVIERVRRLGTVAVPPAGRLRAATR